MFTANRVINKITKNGQAHYDSNLCSIPMAPISSITYCHHTFSLFLKFLRIFCQNTIWKFYVISVISTVIKAVKILNRGIRNLSFIIIIFFFFILFANFLLHFSFISFILSWLLLYITFLSLFLLKSSYSLFLSYVFYYPFYQDLLKILFSSSRF